MEPRVYSKEYPKSQKAVATPGLRVIEDPYQEALKRIGRLETELTQLMDAFKKAEAENKELRQEVADTIEGAKRGLSAEELEQGRKAAGDLLRQDIQKWTGELVNIRARLLGAKRITYIPAADDIVPYGGLVWSFRAGVQGAWPLEVIKTYENRQEQLAEYQKTKGRLGAVPSGQVVTPIMVRDYPQKLRK